MLRGCAAALLALWIAPSAAGADAQVPVRVDYQAPAGCPDAGGFWSELRARTPRVRAAVEREPARGFTLRIADAPGGFVGNLVADSSDTRAVAGRTCAEVVTALALTTALSVDPEAAVAEPAPPPAPVAPVAGRTGPLLDVGAEWLHATLPVELLGPAVGVAWPDLPWLHPRLSLRYLRDVGATSPNVRFQAAIAGAEACTPGAGALALRGCVGVQGGALLGQGQRLDHALTVVTPWVAGTVAVRLAWVHRSGAGVGLDASFIAPAVQPTFIREAPRAELAEVGLGFGAALRLFYRLP